MEPPETEEESIGKVATAYLESWLDGDGERMRLYEDRQPGRARRPQAASGS